MQKPDITIIRGDTESIEFVLTEAGEPVDLTGATVFFTVKPALTDDNDDNTAVIKKEVTDHSDPEEGTTIIPLTHEDTDVAPGEYYYDVQIVRDGTTVTSIKYRVLEIVADVTRRIDELS